MTEPSASQQQTAPAAPSTASTAATTEPPADPPKPAEKRTLAATLAVLSEDDRRFILGEVISARQEAQGLRTRLSEATPKIAEYDRLVEASKTDLERAQEAHKAAETRTAQFRDRAVRAEVKALAATAFADPEDAAAFLQLDQYVTADGDVDTARIGSDLAALLERKPHLGKQPERRTPAPDYSQASSAGGHSAAPEQEFAAFLGAQLRANQLG